MSTRDLVVFGSAAAVPTKNRNHNGYLLRWDGHGIMFDPGEGTQRQMIHAGVGAHDLNWICITHFHGDHCLGVSGIIQRISRDGVPHPVDAAFPASGAAYWERLRHSTVFHDTAVIRERPLAGEEVRLNTRDAPFSLTARRLSHTIETYGYRLEEPDGVTMLPDRLAALGVQGPLIGALQRDGVVTTSRVVTLEECSVPRPGQKAAFVMDTRLCDSAFALAEGVDLLVIEATFLEVDAHHAQERGHLTVAQAGRVAAEAGVRRLVLTHFSERYRTEDEPRFMAEAASVFDGDIVLVHDLDRVPVPPRRAGRPQGRPRP
jgi:ribonuclease Z